MPREQRPSIASCPALIVRGGVAASPGLRLSFQRYECPPNGLLHARPRSLGALPVGLDPEGTVCVPLAENEAFWLGLGVDQPGLRLLVAILAEFAGHEMCDVLTGWPVSAVPPHQVPVPEQRAVYGVRRGDGTLAALARRSPYAPLLGLAVEVAQVGAPGETGPPERLAILLLDFDDFSQRTGQAPPGPLDPQSGYRGWRLP